MEYNSQKRINKTALTYGNCLLSLLRETSTTTISYFLVEQRSKHSWRENQVRVSIWLVGHWRYAQHTHTHSHTHAHTPPVHTLMHTCIHSYMHMHNYPHMHSHTRTPHMHTHPCNAPHTPMHTHMHSCTLTPCACTHAHAHTSHTCTPMHMHAHPPLPCTQACTLMQTPHTHAHNMHTQLVGKTTRLIGSKHLRKPNELIRKLPDKDSHGQAQQVQICTTGPGNTLNKQKQQSGGWEDLPELPHHIT